MSIDWDTFDKGVDAAINSAAAKTDARLASRVSSITSLTNDEIQKLFPTPADVKKLGDLLKIVKAAENQNTKINNLVANIESLAGTVVTLLAKLA